MINMEKEVGKSTVPTKKEIEEVLKKKIVKGSSSQAKSKASPAKKFKPKKKSTEYGIFIAADGTSAVSLIKEKKSPKKKDISQKKPVAKKVAKKNKPKISKVKKMKQAKPLENFNVKTIRIEAEIDDGETEVEIKTPKETIGFNLKTTNPKTVLSKISERTGIDVKKLEKIVEFDD